MDPYFEYVKSTGNLERQMQQRQHQPKPEYLPAGQTKIAMESAGRTYRYHRGRE